MTKNIITYIFIILLGFLLRLISLIFYPVVFLFRHKILEYMLARVIEDDIHRIFILKSDLKKMYLHPYFWMFCFTTGLCDNYSGYYWYKRNLREKWFPEIDLEVTDLEFYIRYITPSFINKIRYFYLCYCWQGWRNSNWAFNEWFFREGKWQADSQRVEYCDPAIGSIYKYWDIIPQVMWDEGNDGGKQLRYPTEDTPVDDIWRCTHEGKKKIIFTTHKGNRRFMYAYCKVTPLRRLKLNLIIEHQFGWNFWNGIPILHFKHILRKTA